MNRRGSPPRPIASIIGCLRDYFSNEQPLVAIREWEPTPTIMGLLRTREGAEIVVLFPEG